MTYRIAMGGLHIECSTFTPYRSGADDFRVQRGQTLLENRYAFHKAYDDRVEFIPLVHAGALPGGIVKREFYESIVNEFVDGVREAHAAEPLSGVFVDLHGAMSVEGLDDAEGDFLARVREAVGSDVPISCPMDLHGNVSQLLFDSADLLSCYRTAPHIDAPETRERAFANLMTLIEHPDRPLYRAWVSVPVLLPGEKTSTEVEPGMSLYAQIPDFVTDDGGLMDVSIWMGFPWADQPRCRGAVCAYGFDRAKVTEAARKIGQDFFDLRDRFEFVGPTGTLEEALDTALTTEARPFFISDTGDNPGAGGDDDTVVVLHELLRRQEQQGSLKKSVLVASIRDREAARMIHEAGEGTSLELSLGAKINPALSEPVGETFTVIHCYDDPMAGPSAVVRNGSVDVIVTSERFQFAYNGAFERAGIPSYDAYDVVVVKIGYLEPDLKAAARGWVMALTPGSVNQDLVSMDFHKLQRPLYPFDPEISGELEVVERNDD